ncbi:Uncharacterized protein dnm_075740 [Desulfonema magnum]|uniref:Uncharacterized protein n=1 Tax=Desulfonema magnum TaxID=45655 RepID=A0A975BTS7_9BACT|nr:Uncharacterized protein dnm_075740 [Desulfonema magnum]
MRPHLSEITSLFSSAGIHLFVQIKQDVRFLIFNFQFSIFNFQAQEVIWNKVF